MAKITKADERAAKNYYIKINVNGVAPHRWKESFFAGRLSERKRVLRILSNVNFYDFDTINQTFIKAKDKIKGKPHNDKGEVE